MRKKGVFSRAEGCREGPTRKWERRHILGMGLSWPVGEFGKGHNHVWEKQKGHRALRTEEENTGRAKLVLPTCELKGGRGQLFPKQASGGTHRTGEKGRSFCLKDSLPQGKIIKRGKEGLCV